MKRVAILQSNYIPWRGYFDIIDRVDLFVFHDDLQYTKNDWRNRNRIKSEGGSKWLTIPCGTDEKRRICDVRVDTNEWQAEHWRRIESAYQKAPRWQFIAPLLEEFYCNQQWSFLIDLNRYFIETVAKEIFRSKTTFDDSRNYALTRQKEDRVLELLEAVGATHYLSGPSAQNYLHAEKFEERGIALDYIDYSNYRDYDQLHPPFDPYLSVIDLIANVGDRAREFIGPSR